MTLTATAFKATGMLAVVCAVMSAATVWLVLSDPVAVATAVNSGEVGPIFSLLSEALGSAFRTLVRYL